MRPFVKWKELGTSAQQLWPAEHVDRRGSVDMPQDFSPPGAIDLVELKIKFGFKGMALAASDAGFAEAAVGDLWNKLQPTRHPQVIAQVTDEQDVVAAVGFARAHGLKVAVRGGGHNWCAPSLRNNGLLIDLSNLNKVISIDAAAGKAVLQPIVSNREVQAALNQLGLSFPTGHCPPVKISGYLLSGGMAWNHGVWGPGVASVEAIEIVDAKGDMITASAVENPEYFWAARGGGPGFFGVATRYHLKVYPLPRAITASVYTYPYETIVDIAEWLGPLASQLPSSVELSLWAVEAPSDLGDKATSSNGKVAMVTATMFADLEEAARSTLAMLEGSPLIDRCLSKSVAQPATFEALFDASGALWPADLRCKVDALFFNSPLADVIRAMKDHVLTAPSPKTVFMLAAFTGPGGAPATPADAAFSMTGKLYGGAWTMWDDAANDAANIAWHDQSMRLLEPFVVGHYVAETDTVAHPEFARLSFAPESWQRLADLRQKHDPDSLFFNFTEGLD
jgi:FAD/FMN-containing dehydrogenase